jgi:type VI secretion system secreted protein VgrG
MSGDVGACTVQLGDPKLIAMRTTLIGEFGTPNIAGLPVVQLPDGSIQVGDAIVIKGDPLFQAKTMAALNQIGQTSTGDKLLNSIDDAGKKVTIQSTAGGNACGYPKATAADRFAGADGKPGKGTDANVFFNSDDDTIGSEEWETRPPAIGLAHELVHAEQATYGSMKRGDADNDSRPDPSDPSQSSQAPIRELEAAGIPPHDKGDFNENKIRSEWNPEQPEREWY